MRAITVRQPWAWAIVHGGKDVENRTRNIAGDYRGPVAIHAGLGWDPSGVEAIRALGAEPPTGFLRGMVLGVVDLVDVHAAGHGITCDPWEGCSPWCQWHDIDHPAMHHLVLADPRPLATPIPARGALSLWTLPADVEAAVLEQVTP